MKTIIYFAIIMGIYFWLLASLKNKQNDDENWRIKKD
jgi:nitrogen fixation-related uncharacterized protein